VAGVTAGARELHLLHSAQASSESRAASDSMDSVHSIPRRKGGRVMKLTFTFIYSSGEDRVGYNPLRHTP